MADTGLLVSHSFSENRHATYDMQWKVLTGKLEVNKGMLLENVVAQMLRAAGQALRYTLDYLVHNYARRTSVHAISGVLKNLAYPCRREDVADYIQYFKDAYLIYSVSVLSDSLAVRRVNPDKYYIVDTGLISATTPKLGYELGWKLENLVFMTLRRGMRKVHYYPLGDNREVDFHVYDQLTGEYRLIQVAWELSEDRAFERELSALKDARRITGIEN